MKIPMTVLSIFAAGALMAQTPAPKAAPQAKAPGEHARGAHREGFMRRMTARLGLTQDQQNQIQAIFKESREHNKDVMAKVKEEHMALREAIKSGSERDIDQITHRNAELNAKVAAMHAKTMAKVYAVLTPDQKAKWDQFQSRRSEGARSKHAG
jgi:Spy/CpxP family protein refolding chaperone